MTKKQKREIEKLVHDQIFASLAGTFAGLALSIHKNTKPNPAVKEKCGKIHVDVKKLRKKR